MRRENCHEWWLGKDLKGDGVFEPVIGPTNICLKHMRDKEINM
jgi:hypothetical protein